MLMAQEAKQDFILHFATIVFSSQYQGANYVSTHLIPDKNTRELRNNVNPTLSKKLKFHVFWTFYVPTKKLRKVGQKWSIMSLSM